MKTMVLAYSGGLDTPVCILPLKERYNYGWAITVAKEVGQSTPGYTTERESKKNTQRRQDK